MTGDPHSAMIIMAGLPMQVTPVALDPFAVAIVVALDPYFAAPACVGVAETECHEKSKAQTGNKVLHLLSSGFIWV